MRGWARAASTALVAASVLAGAPGCRTSCDYGTGDVRRQDWGAAAPMAVDPALTSVPPCPVIPGQRRAEDWAELGPSVRAHLAASGLRPLPAGVPTSEAEAARLLDAAREAGAPLVSVSIDATGAHGVFHDTVTWLLVIGIAPGLVACAIPVHDEIGVALASALVLDPARDEVLGQFFVQRTVQEKATAYGYSPEGRAIDAVESGVEELLEKVAAAARKGFPDRKPATEPLPALLARNVTPGPRISGVPVGVAPAAAAPGPAAPAAESELPAAPAAAPGTARFLDHYEELVVGTTTRAQVLELLGPAAVDRADGERHLLFWVHSQPEAGKTATRMLHVWLRGDVVDEVKLSSVLS